MNKCILPTSLFLSVLMVPNTYAGLVDLFFGDWKGLENNTLSIMQSPVRPDNYSIAYTSTRRGESFSSDVCVFDEVHQTFNCVYDVKVSYNPKQNSFTVHSHGLIVETYYDPSKQKIMDNLPGTWLSKMDPQGKACKLTIKVAEDDLWPGNYYAVYFNDETIPYNTSQIHTDSNHYLLDLSRHVSSSKYVLTLNTDPVLVSQICFGPGDNIFCPESACFEKEKTI